jgi:hypothetical protein
MADDPRDALECFGAAPVDALALGPFLIRRPGAFAVPDSLPPDFPAPGPPGPS